MVKNIVILLNVLSVCDIIRCNSLIGGGIYGSSSIIDNFRWTSFEFYLE